MSKIKKLFNESLSKIGEVSNIVVGYSGGLDSRVLLKLAVEYGFKTSTPVVAVHCHHGISENADAWAEHCKKQAERYGCDFQLELLDLSDSSSNFEARAREARYSAFEKYMIDNDSILLTGHHKNDQAETMLLRLLRGAGVDGLSGIAECRILDKGFLIRPLLDLTKDDLKEYAEYHNVDWVEDESNQSSDYDRNFIRNEVLPLLESRWPSAVKSISKAAEHCRNAREELERSADEDLMNAVSTNRSHALNVEKVKEYSKERRARVIRSWLSTYGLDMPGSGQLEFIDQALIQTEKSVSAFHCNNFSIHLYRGMLILVSEESKRDFHLINVKLKLAKNDRNPRLLNVENPSLCEWRERKEGDKMRYRGHTKSLKKIFQAENIPSWERDQYSILECNGEIVAVGNIISSDYVGTEGYKISI